MSDTVTIFKSAIGDKFHYSRPNGMTSSVPAVLINSLLKLKLLVTGPEVEQKTIYKLSGRGRVVVNGLKGEVTKTVHKDGLVMLRIPIANWPAKIKDTQIVEVTCSGRNLEELVESIIVVVMSTRMGDLSEMDEKYLTSAQRKELIELIKTNTEGDLP